MLFEIAGQNQWAENNLTYFPALGSHSTFGDMTPSHISKYSFLRKDYGNQHFRRMMPCAPLNLDLHLDVGNSALAIGF